MALLDAAVVKGSNVAVHKGAYAAQNKYGCLICPYVFYNMLIVWQFLSQFIHEWRPKGVNSAC